MYTITVQRLLDDDLVQGIHPRATGVQYSHAMPAYTRLAVDIVDQAELLGILVRLHNMGLIVLAVEKRVMEGDAARKSAARFSTSAERSMAPADKGEDK